MSDGGKALYESAAAVLDAQRSDLAADLFLQFVEQIRRASDPYQTSATLTRFLADHEGTSNA